MTGFVKIILEASFTAGLAVLAVVLVRLAMKKVPKRWAYALWAVVFFRCLCPFSVESGLSVFNAVPELRSEAELLDGLSDIAESNDTENILPVHTDLNKYGYQTAAPNVPNVPEYSESPEYAPPVQMETVPEKKPVDKYAVMLGVWAFGAAAMALYGVVSYTLLMRKLRTAIKTEDGVYESDRVSTAFSAGFFPPKIYVPCGLFDEERKLIIAHERVHIKRLDYIVKPIAFAALAVHWFNPLIWVAFALMTRDMELSCDEAVLKIFGAGEKKAYSEALLRVSMKRSGLADSYNFLPLAFAETGIKGRVKNVLKYKKPTVIVTVIAAVVVVAACVVLGTNAKSNAIEYTKVGVTSRLMDANGNKIYFYVDRNTYNAPHETNGVYYSRALIEGEEVQGDVDSAAFSFGNGSLKKLIMAVDMTEFKINDMEIFEENGKGFLRFEAQFEFTNSEGKELPELDGLIRLGGDEEPRQLTVKENKGIYTVCAEYGLTQSGENGCAFILKDFEDIPVYVNKELLIEYEEEYTLISSSDGITEKLTDANGNNIYFAVMNVSSDKNGVHITDDYDFDKAFFEALPVPDYENAAGFNINAVERLVMDIDIDELKINDLEIYEENGKKFLKAEFNIVTDEDPTLFMRDDLIRLDGEYETKQFFVEGGGKKGVSVSAEYELTQNWENGVYVFVMKDFGGIPIYVNTELVGISEEKELIRSNENTDDNASYQQVFDGTVTNLSLDGYVPAYLASGLEDTGSTGVIGYSDTIDGGQAMYTGFHDDYRFQFHNAYTGNMESVRIANYGQNDYVHILGMSTKNGANTFATSLFDMEEFGVKSIALDDMYTETEGDKLYLNIRLVFTSDDVIFERLVSYPANNEPCSYSVNIEKISNGKYAAALKVNYFDADSLDSFAVILSGFEDAEKYVAPKLVLDYPVFDEYGEENPYENAELQKVYKGENFYEIIELFDGGLFRYENSISSYKPYITSRKEYRYEEDKLILTFNDGSELCFDVGDGTLTFNERASRRTDARSRNVPWFKNGTVFTFDGDSLIRFQIEKRRRNSYQYESFIDCDETEMVYSRDTRSIYLLKDGKFEVNDFSDEYIPQNDLRDGYSIDGDTLSLKYTDGSVLCFDMVPSAMEETDPELAAEMDMCRYKLVYRKEKSHISEGQTGDIPEFYNGEIFEPDKEFIMLKKEVGEIRESEERERLQAEEELRQLDEQERLKAEEALKSSFPMLSYPARGDISEKYGGDRGHKGIDFAAEKGEEIYAAYEGTVTAVGSGWNGGYGSSVTIDHGMGMETFYAHLSEVAVQEGDEVFKGDVIGHAGSTGDAVDTCLHFEVRINGEHVNPEDYLGLKHFDGEN